MRVPASGTVVPINDTGQRGYTLGAHRRRHGLLLLNDQSASITMGGPHYRGSELYSLTRLLCAAHSVSILASLIETLPLKTHAYLTVRPDA